MISIIIPVYNAYGTLSRCVESVLAQQFAEWEVWLVDDGSTDGSGELCDRWSQREERIHKVHQPNSGPSAARNRGLACACGEMVSFLDADDVIHPQYLEILHSLLSPEVDIACVSYQLVKDVPQWPKELQLVSPRYYTSVDAMAEMLYQGDIDPSPWGKLYRKHLAEHFPEQYCLYEDLYHTVHLLSKAQRVVAVSLPLYGYFKNNTGLHMQAAVSQDVFKVFDELESWIGGQYSDLLPALHSRRLSVAFNNIRLMLSARKLNKKVFCQCCHEIARWRHDVWQDSHVRLKSKIGIFFSYLFCYR